MPGFFSVYTFRGTGLAGLEVLTFAYLRSKFRDRPLTLEASDKRPEALNVPRIRSKN